ncbi:Phenylacetate-coenzyme A ligase [bacterium HR28]|jgi:phenylacetate-CoA ligase|uniref:Phenylacetate--CoA ligase family protein n=1 Tax=Thermomicrobium roseum TaxID=500 RepID=A0A7C1G541_THERO|nr:Phenylacetate-coenzyme A ligase [bacterium HR28]
MAERRYWNEVMETIDPERLWQLEDERLRWQLRWVWERSPFYRQKFSEAGIDPLTIGRDSLHLLPFTVKDEVRRTQQDYPPLGGHACVPLHEVVRIHASSGTTGQPTLVGLTEADARAWNEVLARFFWTTGVRPGTRVWLAVTLGWYIAGLSFYEALRAIQATVYPSGTMEATRTFNVIQRAGVDYMVSSPTFVNFLTHVARERLGIDPASLGIKAMALGGEPGAGVPQIRQQIEETWGCKVYDAMGTADFAPILWTECEAQAGMHFVGQGFVIAEFIEPETGRPIEPKEGMLAELVYTAIQRECVPLIRFRIGDLVRIEGTGRCECGRTGIRIRCVGRVDDMFIVRGVNVFPSAVADVIASFRPRVTGEFQIRLPARGLPIDPPVPIVVELGPEPGDLHKLKRDLEEAIRAQLIFRATVQLVPKGELTPTGTMKRQVIVRGEA